MLGTELAKIDKTANAMTAELQEKKQRYVSRGISHTYPIIISEAKGAVIKDLEGNTYIDFFGGIGVLNAGHCPEPVVQAVKDQADKYLHTCFMATMYEPYIKLAEKIVSITPGKFDKSAMFICSGAEAVENAIKIAKAYTKKPGIIAFEAGFHGRTLMTMTLTSKVKPYKIGFGPFAPEVYKVPSAYCYRCPYNSTYPQCGMHCLDRFERFFTSEVDPSNIAAMIIEPVQGEGGFIVPPPGFLPGLKEICEKNDILFIADEIQTGFARTGKMFAVEHFGVEPDLMTMAKSIASGLPLSGVVGKSEIMNSPNPGNLGGTYGGSPLACAAGLATIEYIEQEKLCDRALIIGETCLAKLKPMQEKYPQIGDIRSLGAMIGIEFVKDKATKEPAKEEVAAIVQECFKRGLLVISAGIYGNVIRILMPLVITDAQLEQALSIFEESLGQVLKPGQD